MWERGADKTTPEAGRELPQVPSESWQKPDPIRLYSQGQQNGFYPKGNENPVLVLTVLHVVVFLAGHLVCGGRSGEQWK